MFLTGVTSFNYNYTIINMSIISSEREKCAHLFDMWEINVHDIVSEVRTKVQITLRPLLSILKYTLDQKRDVQKHHNNAIRTCLLLSNIKFDRIHRKIGLLSLEQHRNIQLLKRRHIQLLKLVFIRSKKRLYVKGETVKLSLN